MVAFRLKGNSFFAMLLMYFDLTVSVAEILECPNLALIVYPYHLSQGSKNFGNRLEFYNRYFEIMGNSGEILGNSEPPY